MFKKLKEKITEEVKISPQRFADFTQSVSDRLQNNTSADENFFSIGEDDLNTSTSSNNHGFSSVTLVSPSQEDKPRRNSNASIASDISFLPRYEASNMYHIQSDLDISASEMEDNVSNVSSQLGHLSKEQIHSAFQKSQMRYHKYRGRFTDLARHYKDLERENAKMKAVLVETQDKAIRRVQELKEQCSLEQKAKAHLESALRDEIDEKNYKIKTLETKISLLKPESNAEQLIAIDGDSDNQNEKMESLTKYLNDARKEIESLNEKLQEMKANTIIFQTKEQDYKTKIAAFEKEISSFAEREKENNLKLAQNKMELHNEMLMKDTEISNLKRENEVLKQNLNTLDSGKKNSENTKLENLQSQNKKLIDKIESLTQKSNTLGKEVLKIESCKFEIENLKQEISDLKSTNGQLTAEKETLINDLSESEKKYKELSDRYQELDKSILKEREELEDQINKLRDEARKGLLSLEPKIREKIQTQFSEKEIELKREFENKIEELSSNNVGIKEIKLQLLLKDDLIKNISEELESLKSEISKKTENYGHLETDHLELIEDCTRLRNTISNLEKEKVSLESYEEKIPRLEAHIKTLQEELKESRQLIERKETESAEYNTKIIELQNTIQENDYSHKVNEEIKTLNETVKQSQEEINILKEKLQIQQEKCLQLNDQKSQLSNEVDRLTETLTKIKENEELIDSVKSDHLLLKSRYEKLEEERQILTKDLFNIKKSLSETEDSIDTESDSSPNQIIMDIKKLNEVKEKKIITLNEKNTKLEQDLNNVTEKCRILEDKLETIQVENTELKIVELTLQKLRQENNKIVQDFEEQRKEFNQLFHNHKKIQEKEKTFDEVAAKLNEVEEEKCKLQLNLSSLNASYIQLQEENLDLQNSVANLQEKVYILEEKEKASDLDKTECHKLQIKLQKLGEEMKHLLDSFEMQRVRLSEANEILTHKEIEITELTEEKFKVKHSFAKCEDELTNLKNILDQLCKDIKIKAEIKIKETENIILSLEESKAENKVLVSKITEMSEINDSLKRELQERDTQIKELTRNVSNLNEKLQKEYSENKFLQEKNQSLDANFGKKEAEMVESANIKQSQLTEELKELNNKIELENSKNNKLNENITNLEKLNAEQFSKIEISKKEIVDLQNKISSLQDEEKKDHNEISRLKNLLNEKEDFLNKFNEMESKFNSILEENHRLVEENINLQENDIIISDLESKNDILEKQLEISKNDLSELKVRCQQITSDYQNMLHENQILSNAKEEFEIKVHEVDNLKLSYEESQNNIREENQKLKEKIEEMNNNLQNIQKQNLELVAQSKESSTSEVDIVNIKRDFYEIKEKCDSLFVENKNLTQEYAKLEDKCNKFSEMKEKMQNQISELEKNCTEILHEKQLLQDEIQELKILPLNLNNNSSKSGLDQLEILKQEQLLSANDNDKELFRKEIEILRDKITKYKSLDITNKSSIEFYENELQKVKNQNDKLNRKLDETLVTLQHCAELSTSTEVEYLKNVLFNYMLGKEGLVLARVIAAVCKFDPQQTELILQREQQKQTLLGQLGFI